MIFKLLSLFAIFTLLHAATSETNQCVPTHLQLSLGDTYYSMSRLNDLRLPSEHINDNQAYLAFQAHEQCQFVIRVQKSDDEVVVFEKPVDHIHNPNNPNDEVEEVEKSVESHPVIYNVLLENLSYETKYQYTIFDHEGSPVAGPLTFRLTDPHVLDETRKILIAGSLNNQEHATNTINQLSSLASSNYQDYAAFLQLGNIHFEFADKENQEDYENFLDKIRSFTSILPTAISVDGNGDFKTQPIRNPLYDMTHNHYFSFNLQGIHFVSINFDYYEASPLEIKEKIDRWIENDFEQANDAAHRKLWPWLVVLSSKSVYCLEGTDACQNYGEQQKLWDELFFSYKVDLVISGNAGEYERLGPMYQKKRIENQENSPNTAPAYIIEGAGRKISSNTTEEQLKKTGYGIIRVQNTTANNEIKLIYEHYDSETQTKVDSYTLTKSLKVEEEASPSPVTPIDDAEENDIAAPTNKIDIKLISMIALGVGLVVAAIIGIVVWRKKKGSSEDPEVEGLKRSELKSNKIYSNKRSDKSISMVDLVL